MDKLDKEVRNAKFHDIHELTVFKSKEDYEKHLKDTKTEFVIPK